MGSVVPILISPRVGSECSNVVNAQAQLVEDDTSALQQQVSAIGQLDTMRMTIEQRCAEYAPYRDRLGYGGL